MADFENKINDWCEFTSVEFNIPRTEMCMYAKQVFGDKVSTSWIYHCINQKYKVPGNVYSAKQKVTSKERKINSLRKIAKRMGLNIVGAIEDAVNPLNEVGSMVAQDGSK